MTDKSERSWKSGPVPSQKGRVAPSLIVLSILYPRRSQPTAGLFVKERMTRVGTHLPVTVVSPVPWFPLQGLIRRWRTGFRPPAPYMEEQAGIEVYHPRFLSFPGVLKSLDGFFLALASLPTVYRLKNKGANIIDAHFAYPEGHAAGRLGAWLKMPVVVTLRGTEIRMMKKRALRHRIAKALARADRIFSVSASLLAAVKGLDIDMSKARVIGNGVDTEYFFPGDKKDIRNQLGIPEHARVLISVGTLVERKGFHRVIELLPRLSEIMPDIMYLVVGGPGPEGDWQDQLRRQVEDRGLHGIVRFTGHLEKDDLRAALSSADLFVLATSNEGWANVFLEAMACGLPVVTTDVGGNREVISSPSLGTIVPYGDKEALSQAILEALERRWDRSVIIEHARENSWDSRVEALVDEFRLLTDEVHDQAMHGIPRS